MTGLEEGKVVDGWDGSASQFGFTGERISEEKGQWGRRMRCLFYNYVSLLVRGSQIEIGRPAAAWEGHIWVCILLVAVRVVRPVLRLTLEVWIIPVDKGQE